MARALCTRWQVSAREEREVVLHVTRGKDLSVKYMGRISTKDLLLKFASAKRVGRHHLVLKVYKDGAWHTFRANDDVHLACNWTGLTLMVENRRCTQPVVKDIVRPEHTEWQQSHLDLLEMRNYGKQEDISSALSCISDAGRELGIIALPEGV
eukprot:948544-Amphidinium_carterae.1